MSARPVPPLLLSSETLLGVTRAPRERTLAALRRYSAPGALASAFRDALQAGAAGVTAIPSALTRDALRTVGTAIPAYAIVPNVPAFVRDSSERGLVGAALQRVKGAPPASLVRLGLTGASHVTGVLANDLIGMVPVMLELECAALAAPRLEAVVLASTLTDLALAGGHQRFFRHYVEFVHGRFGVRAGFETHNLGHLLARLREWNVSPDLVVGPLNPLGFMMKPSPAQVLAELRATSIPVIAKELRAGGVVPLVEGAAYARLHGAQGVMVDLVDVDRDVSELGSVRR